MTKHYRSLDGLRGIAALIVVIYHSMIATPRFAEIRLRPGEQVLDPLEIVVVATPLRLLWAGSEAVIVFFVLSGFVLSLPFVRRRNYPGLYFYPRRMLRLYLPAIASLGLSFLLAMAVPRVFIPGASMWVNEHAGLPNGPLQVLMGSSLMYGWGGLNLSLWSLRWEVLFSVSLAAFLWFARENRAAWWAKATVGFAVCILWPLSNMFYPNGVYIVVFLFGVLMAQHIDLLNSWAARISPVGWLGLVLLAAALLTYSGILVGVHAQNLGVLLTLWVGLASVGAVIVVFASMYWAPLVRALESPVAQWLGLVCFSLYLIQDPVVVSLAELTGGLAPPLLMVPLGIASCLAVSHVFYLLVERPSHRVSRSFLKKREQARALSAEAA